MHVADAMIEAERKAWDSLARYKFLMFGYHAAQWVTLNKLDSPKFMSNPWKSLVDAARLELRRRVEGESTHTERR